MHLDLAQFILQNLEYFMIPVSILFKLLGFHIDKKNNDQEVRDNGLFMDRFFEHVDSLKTKLDDSIEEQSRLVITTNALKDALREYKDLNNILLTTVHEKQNELDRVNHLYGEMLDSKVCRICQQPI